MGKLIIDWQFVTLPSKYQTCTYMQNVGKIENIMPLQLIVHKTILVSYKNGLHGDPF